MPEDEIYGKWGRRFMNMAVAQGIPTPIISLMDLESIAPNRRAKVKHTIQKYVQKSFPIEKLVSLDTNSDGFNVFRRIGDQKKKILYNKDNRPHLFAENIEYVENTSDAKAGTLKVTGYLRGISLDVNSLVHIPNLGDFQMSQIDVICEDNDAYVNSNHKMIRNVKNFFFFHFTESNKSHLPKKRIHQSKCLYNVRISRMKWMLNKHGQLKKKSLMLRLKQKEQN